MTPVLEVRGLSKEFGGVYALRDVNLAVLPGEVHGLLGQNGSGKSTLIKIVSGYHEPEPGGELLVNGSAVGLPLRPGQFRDLNISFVHQDLGLVDSRSVLDNLSVGRFHSRPGRPISWRDERRAARRALAMFDLAVSPDARVAGLKDVERALVAIVRAVQDIEARDHAGLLVLDEPTVYLPKDSVDQLVLIMRQIVELGHGILFVSHQLSEVKAITDRVSVLRDGRLVGTADTGQTSEAKLVHMILGRELGELYPEPSASARSDVVLRVDALYGGMAEDVSFELRTGEVLGLTGLIGAGFEDVPYLLYGAQRARDGVVTIEGKRTLAADASPSKSVRRGVVLVPGNRLRDGVVRNRTVEDNVGLPVLHRHFRTGLLRLRSLRKTITSILRTFDVRPPVPQRTMGTLSGGNQQKAVLAKWIQAAPAILLMHEPTQGVDVGARKQIYKLIRDATNAGTAVLIASGEHDDLAHVCDRVLVFRNGHIVTAITGAGLTAERIEDESYRSMSSPVVHAS